MLARRTCDADSLGILFDAAKVVYSVFLFEFESVGNILLH